MNRNAEKDRETLDAVKDYYGAHSRFAEMAVHYLERAISAEQRVAELEESLNHIIREKDEALTKYGKLNNKVSRLKWRVAELEKALEEIKDEEWRLAGEFTTIYTAAYLALKGGQE